MVDRVQTSEINNSADINGVVQKSLSVYLKRQKAQRADFIQTVRRGSWMRSVQCCTKWLVLVTVCVCGGGGVRGSELNGAWGKRGGGGESRERVQLPDSLMYEAVLQSAGPRPETTQSSSLMAADWRSCVSGGGITCNAEGFAGETGAVDVLEGGERDTNDLLSCSHYPLKGLAAGRVAGTIPHRDAASQDALDGASVEGAHDGGRGSGYLAGYLATYFYLACAPTSPAGKKARH